ncbi:MAG: polysaccharide deacetylase family protein [Ginsengibacter sp.]
MVVIYAAQYSSRLQYITSFIFNDLLHTPFQITTDSPDFNLSDDIKVCYDQEINGLTIIAANNLLFEKNVISQQIRVGLIDDFKTLFPTETDSTTVFPFDIFAASFYLLSRYEEYLPNEKDEHGRYYYRQSIAFKEGFLRQPLINIWVKYFAEWLKEHEPSFQYELPKFTFIPTYDVDIAYEYTGQGVLKNFNHLFKSIVTLKPAKAKQQLDVLKGNTADPFDIFSDLIQLNKTYNIPGIFFLLTIFKKSKFDKNTIISDPKTKRLFKHLSASTLTGLHPSYQSNNDDNLLLKEKNILESILQEQQVNIRYHYLKFILPEGYTRLIKAGFTDDYSMGYGQVQGFRASVATPFDWYDLSGEEITTLKIHPFCFMDSTSIFGLKHTPSQAFIELQKLYNNCQNVGGECITIFHNHFMGQTYGDWKIAYEKFIQNNCT